MTKPVILTGLRANNDLHIGNYLGALLPLVDMANKKAGDFQINAFIPDLHSFTTPIDHSQLHDQIVQTARLLTAAGLDITHPDVYLYRQSYVPAHSELTWILDCFTGDGEMSRMTQFKDKAAKLGVDRVSVGLFHYPVLMASDILLYHASYVPVGDDQTQHLEFTRDIAMRLNKRFSKLFTIPLPVAKQHEFFGKDQGLRIKDLVDPSKKMSKSDDTGKGVIFLTDSPQTARKKIMSATTDSLNKITYDPNKQPGIANLLQILALLKNEEVQTTASRYAGQTTYGALKQDVSEIVGEFLTDFQQKLSEVDDKQLLSKLKSSENAMNVVANATLLKVQKAVGLR